ESDERECRADLEDPGGRLTAGYRPPRRRRHVHAAADGIRRPRRDQRGGEHRSGGHGRPLRRVLCRRSGEGPARADEVRQPGQGDVLRNQPDAGEARAVPDGKDLSRAAPPAGSDLAVGRNPRRGGDARVRRPAVIRAVVAGAGGRMGSRVLAALREEKDFAVTGAFERAGSEHVGRDADGIAIVAGIDDALGKGADVVIDFTAPSASLQHASVCAARGVALVIGTTGFAAEQKNDLRTAARRIPLVLAPNMSVGVNVLFRLVAEAARALGSAYEVEIVEMHHRMKRDAPSGTALRLAEIAAEALGPGPEQSFVYARHGDTGPRKKGSIGLQSLP